MKQITIKVILSIICCSLLATAVFGAISIYHNRRVLKDEVETKLLYAAQKYANEFSTEFQTQENTVEAVSATATSFFDTSAYRNDRQKFLVLNEQMDAMMKNTISASKDVKCVYITYNPNTSGGNDETWYMRNEQGKVVFMSVNNKRDDWLVESNHESDYYFGAIEKGSYWTGVQYDIALKADSVTYAKAIYDKNNELIGVAGTDIFTEDMFKTIENIQLNEGGQALLLDQNNEYIIGSKGTSAAFKTNLNTATASLVTKEKDSGLVETDIEKEGYFISYAKLSNGWTFLLLQPENLALASVHNMIQLLLIMALLVVAGIVFYAIYFSRKAVAPIIYEVNQKDLILHHQSRQAKLGEMVGNIAHQWKQPLNVMGITLSNMEDDFNQGLMTQAQIEEYLAGMRLSIKTMSSTVDDFTNFLKPDREKENFDVNKEISIALSLMAESIKINRIIVENNSVDGFPVKGYKNEFCQGIFNILSNARDAIIEADPEERLIKIGLRNDSGHVVIEIFNQGNRIPEEILPKLFDPYFTTKNDKEGVGIGLYLTKEIIVNHFGGTIEIFNTADGVCCKIILPGEPQ